MPACGGLIDPIFFRANARKTKKHPQKAQKHPPKSTKTPKKTKKTPILFSHLRAEKKSQKKKKLSRLRAKNNHLPGSPQMSQKRRNSRSARHGSRRRLVSVGLVVMMNFVIIKIRPRRAFCKRSPVQLASTQKTKRKTRPAILRQHTTRKFAPPGCDFSSVVV